MPPSPGDRSPSPEAVSGDQDRGMPVPSDQNRERMAQVTLDLATRVEVDRPERGTGWRRPKRANAGRR